MLDENHLTDLLFERVLAQLPAAATTAFLREVCGVPATLLHGAETYRIRTQVPFADVDAGQLLLVGLSPTGLVEWTRESAAPGQVDGFVLLPGRLLVVFENKIDTYMRCDGDQLLRELRVWRADLPRDVLHAYGQLPSQGVQLTTWARVRTWVVGQLRTARSGPGADALAQLAGELDEPHRRLLATDDTSAPPPTRPVGRVPDPPRTPSPVILAEARTRLPDVTLSGVHQVGLRLYGPGGTDRLNGDACQCVEDSQAICERHRELGWPVPDGMDEKVHGVAGDIMTPRRILTGMHAWERRPVVPEGRRDLVLPDAVKPWGIMQDRYLRGGNQAALLCALAWADHWQRRGRKPRQAANVREAVERLWALLPWWTPSTPALHAALEALGGPVRVAG